MADAEIVARDQLRSIVQRIERLEEEKKALSEDIREVYAEAKANGFDVKALRAIVRLRKQSPTEREEHEAILATYMVALGMVQERFDFGETASGPPEPPTSPEATKRAGAKRKRAGQAEKAGETLNRKVGRKVREAVAAFGEPVPLTEEEKAAGMSAAVLRPDGTRVAMGIGGAS